MLSQTLKLASRNGGQAGNVWAGCVPVDQGVRLDLPVSRSNSLVVVACRVPRQTAPTYTPTIVNTPDLRVVQVTLFMAFALILNTTVTKVLCRIGNRSGTRGGVISGERGVIKLFDSECGVIFH